MLSRPPKPAFPTDQRSAAALEFAFVAPILVILFLGVIEICNAAIVYEEVQNAAHSIPASASAYAVQGNGSTTLTYAQVQFAASQIFAQVPQLRTGFQNGTKSVTISSVTFLQTSPATCTPSKTTQCEYTPTVVWSIAYTGGDSGRTFTASASSLRSCASTTPIDAQVPYGATYKPVPGGLNNNAPPSLNIPAATAATWQTSDLASLPTYEVADPDPYLAPPSPVLIVDIHLQYTPIFGLVMKNNIDFYASGMYPVRSVQASQVNASSGATTALSLSQQFTTITTDSTTDGQNGVIAGGAAGAYCLNNSPYLNPTAYTVPAPSS